MLSQITSSITDLPPTPDSNRHVLGLEASLHVLNSRTLGTGRGPNGAAIQAGFGLPLLRLPTPANANPEEIRYEQVRVLVQRLQEGLLRAEIELAQAPQFASIRIRVDRGAHSDILGENWRETFSGSSGESVGATGFLRRAFTSSSSLVPSLGRGLVAIGPVDARTNCSKIDAWHNGSFLPTHAGLSDVA